MYRRLATVALAGFVLVVAGSSELAVSPRANAGASSNCTASVDPYTQSRAADLACGDNLYRLTAKLPLAGGGSEYEYNVGGGIMTMLVPPPDFNPLTASSALLTEYGFPLPPRNPSALAAWQAMASNVHPVAAPSMVIQIPVTVPQMSASA